MINTERKVLFSALPDKNPDPQRWSRMRIRSAGAEPGSAALEPNIKAGNDVTTTQHVTLYLSPTRLSNFKEDYKNYTHVGISGVQGVGGRGGGWKRAPPLP